MPGIQLLEVVSGLGMGGAERALLTRLKYSPPNVKQIVLNMRPEIDSLRTDPGIALHEVSGRGLRRLIGAFIFLRQNNFDAIIVRTPLDAIRFGLFKNLCFAKKPKLIFEAHNNYVSKKFGLGFGMQFLLRRFFRTIDLIVAVSKNVSQGPQCRGHKNVQVILLGAELEGCLEIETTSPSARLIFIGRLVDVKRPVWLLERIWTIKALHTLPKNALTIVGDGPLMEDLRKYVLTHNLSDVVNLVGKQLDVTPYLLSATHMVSCSLNEGLPLTFFEAKLAGLAILATPSGGGAEIFGPEDRELNSFNEKEFEEALLDIFRTSPSTLELRRKIQEGSQSFRASECAKEYYFRITQCITTK